LIEDFLARTSLPRCVDFRETAEVISKVGFKTFINITPSISFPSVTSQQQSPRNEVAGMTGPTEFILTFDENPLAEFAELPLDAMGGKYAKAAEEKKALNWDLSEIGGQDEGLVQQYSLWRDSGELRNGMLLPFASFIFYAVTLTHFVFSLPQLQMQVEATFVSDRLRGDDSTDIHVKLIRIMEEEQPINDE
jgi:hypothetical protein